MTIATWCALLVLGGVVGYSWGWLDARDRYCP